MNHPSPFFSFLTAFSRNGCCFYCLRCLLHGRLWFSRFSSRRVLPWLSLLRSLQQAPFLSLAVVLAPAPALAVAKRRGADYSRVVRARPDQRAERIESAAAFGESVVRVCYAEYNVVMHASRLERWRRHHCLRPVERAVAGDARGNQPVVTRGIQASRHEADLNAVFEVNRCAFNQRHGALRTHRDALIPATQQWMHLRRGVLMA